MTFSRKNEDTGEDNISDTTPIAKADRYMYRAWLCEILEHLGLPLRNCSTFLTGVTCCFIFCFIFCFFLVKKKFLKISKSEIYIFKFCRENEGIKVRKNLSMIIKLNTAIQMFKVK